MRTGTRGFCQGEGTRDQESIRIHGLDKRGEYRETQIFTRQEDSGDRTDGRVRTKTVNALKLKKASILFYRDRVVKEKWDASRHVDEAIERLLKKGLLKQQ